MKRMLFLCLVCLLGVTEVKSLAQRESDPLLSLALRYEAAGMYEAAITEFKRYMFFHPDDENIAHIQALVARCYRSAGDTSRAAENYISAIRSVDNDSLKQALRLDLATTYIAAGKQDLARLTLSRVNNEAEETSTLRRASFLEAMAAIYDFRWQDARSAFHRYAHYQCDSAFARRIDRWADSVFADAEDVPYRSPSTAKWLSSFIPGAGQIYAGEFWTGLNALALNAVMLSFVVDAAIDGRYVALATTHLPFFYRYYSGNRDHAEEYALHFNRAANQQYATKLLVAIQAMLQSGSVCK